MSLFKWAVPAFLLLITSGSVSAQVAEAKWSANSPAPGGNPGSVSTGVSWANCTGAAKVEVVLYKTVGKAQVQVSKHTLPVTLASGTWGDMHTGLTSGTVITAADVRVLNAGGGIIAATLKENISVTVP